MKTFLFPGQGSQAKGMGGALFDDFKELINQADKILGYSIKELCLKNPKGKLHQTQFTQPALYVVNALSYFKKIDELGQKPDYVAGHSLGEFNALLAAECFDFETGLKLVKKRGELMSQASNGGMAAILNATKEDIERILKENGLFNIDLGNYNTPSQTVISGLREEVIKAQPFFEEGTMRFVHLNTSGAFHSRFMESARKEFERFLENFTFSPLKIPVISNVFAKPYQSDNILETLSQQITNPVNWSDSIQYLLGLGPMDFEEIGFGEILSKLVKKIITETRKPLENPSKSSRENEEMVSLSAEEKVRVWNQKYPIGTRVKSIILDDEDLETKTEAIILFGHRAAVYMKGYNGYFDLDETIPL